MTTDTIATLADALEAERAENLKACALLASVLVEPGALVAAAYEAAAQAVRAVLTNSPTGEWGEEGISMSRAIERAICALTPADAKTALDKLLAEARMEGWRAGRDAAAEVAAASGIVKSAPLNDGCGTVIWQPVSGSVVAAAIRALPEPKGAEQ